jgi:probable O-glycosylation ligase (exosortase A-associated)
VRDVVLALLMAVLLPIALRRPDVGAYLWAWVSLMNPHQLTFGFARSLPWAAAVAGVTLLGTVFYKDRKPMPVNGGTVLLLMLMAWMTLTSFFALNDHALVWDRWIFVMKSFVMLLVTFMLLRGRTDIERLIWVVVVSVGFFGVKGGIWTVLTGGSGRVWGPPGGMLAGNNELAVGLVLLLPFMYYLRETASRRWVKLILFWSMVFASFAILGSQSRGALLSVLAMAFMLGLKGKYPVRTSLGLGLLVVLVIAFMPDSWTQRMDTIQTYQADTSAMSRIWTWTTLWNAAVDRPLVGAGLQADNLRVFAKYAPVDGYEVFQGKVFVAHSIYFQALGEHGFPGLALYLGIGLWIWFAAGRLARTARTESEFASWVPLLMWMCQVSLIGFAVGGAFLSLMLLDLPYYILGVVVLTHATVHEHRRRRPLGRPKEVSDARPLSAPGHVAAGRPPA